MARLRLLACFMIDTNRKYTGLFISRSAIVREAEDLCHQVFLTAWQNIGNYKHRGFPFSSWLYSISKNKVVDYYRANKISINIENIQIEDNKNRSEKLLDEKINLENVKEAIKKLTDKEQNIIILRFIEGFSPKRNG